MTEQKSALIRLFGVSLLWGCNYVVSASLLGYFSPIFLSCARICMTSIFLILIGLRIGGLKKPTKAEWLLLAGAGIFGTLMNQVFYFTGLKESTAANAALIVAMAPIVTTVLERIFMKVALTTSKIFGAVVSLAGVVIIVGFAGQSMGISNGDIYLLLAMLGLSISLLFIRKLTESMSSYSVTIFSTVLGSALMIPAAGGEAVFSHVVMSRMLWPWGLMALAGIVAQGMAGFWWNRGVAVIGAGTASMFMNIPPFIAIIAGHFVLGDPIYTTQILGGICVLAGVFIANRSSLRKPAPLEIIAENDVVQQSV